MNNDAAIEGRVDETSPEASNYSAATIWSSSGSQASAETVVVGEAMADGSVSAIAEADVQADGSFRIEGVPTNRDNLVVVARSNGEAVGRVLVHQRTRANTVITTAPINYETTLEAIAYSEMKASGRAEASSSQEVALLIHADQAAAASLMANGEVSAAAEGAATASEAMTRVFAGTNTALDATTRASLMADAAIQFSESVHSGTSVDAAHEQYLEATLDAWLGAGASADAVATATASAASTFDATVHGKASARGQLISEAVKMNLKARQRLAAQFEGSSEGSVALAIQNVLAETEASVRGASTAADIRAAMDAHASAAADATVSAVMDRLVADAGLVLRNEVETKAEAAIQAANLSARLEGAAHASAAAEAVANYRSAVRAAVDAMIEASGETNVDAEAMTSLFIAAHGGAYVRAN